MKSQSIWSLVIITVLLISVGCNKKDKLNHEPLLMYPTAIIHAEFSGSQTLITDANVKGTGTSREGIMNAHYGVISSASSASLYWEFIGQSKWTDGDVYLLKLTDPKHPAADWVKTVLFKGTPIDLINSTNIQISIKCPK